MRRIVHVIPRLVAGGAERMLVDICTRVDRSRFDPVVISLADRGPLAAPLEEAQVAVHSVGFHPSLPNPAASARLVRLLRALQPDVVETWLYKADLLGGLATVLAGRPPLLWSVQQTHLEPVGGRLRSNVVTARVCARLSGRLPTLILCASQPAADAHEAIGYRAAKLRIVPNGVDTDRFRPDPTARGRIRAELAVADGTPVVGLVARFDPQKDHATFVEAARRILDRVGDAQFVLCGRGIVRDNVELARLIDRAGIGSHVSLLGVRDDMPAVTAAFDVAMSSSAFGEAFSVALSEALATAVPCVATDSGNAVELVGEAGRVVPPRDAEGLAAGVAELLALPDGDRRDLGARGRERIVSHFSIATVARGYEETYEEVMRVARART
jgi:glycosyltransferase involved in cell wall biosynthesis